MKGGCSLFRVIMEQSIRHSNDNNGGGDYFDRADADEWVRKARRLHPLESLGGGPLLAKCCFATDVTLVGGEGDGDGRKICVGEIGDKNGDGGFGFSDSSKGTDGYYMKVIEANPCNSVVLGSPIRVRGVLRIT